MKKILVAIMISLLLGLQKTARACDVCRNNQPKVLRDITHGTGPQGHVDYIIIWSAVVIVAATLFLSLKYLIRPKENSSNHIKNIVLK